MLSPAATSSLAHVATGQARRRTLTGGGREQAGLAKARLGEFVSLRGISTLLSSKRAAFGQQCRCSVTDAANIDFPFDKSDSLRSVSLLPAADPVPQGSRTGTLRVTILSGAPLRDYRVRGQLCSAPRRASR
jgi:hypothetical protein